LREEDASTEKCSSAPTSDDDKNKCIYNGEEGKCEEKTLCNKVTTPSKLSCTSAITEDETKTRCFFEAKDDSISGDTDKCIAKEICSKVNSPSADTCSKATTLDPKTKCSFVEGSAACTTTNRVCTEITDGASTDVCESIETSSGKECKFDETNGKCVETTQCKNVGTITDETLCTTAPTSNDLTMKCVVKTVEGIKSCDEEPKTCSEIKKGATDEICGNAPVTDSTKKKCKLNSLKAGECIETDKENETAENTGKAETGDNTEKTEKAETEDSTKKPEAGDSAEKTEKAETEDSTKKPEAGDSAEKTDKADSPDKKDDNNGKIMKFSLSLIGLFLL
jgi:hypothetical protein